MYKLVALDIDGTLLNEKHELTDRTIDVIQKAMDKGIIVTLSTGRPLVGVQEYYKLLNMKCPLITYNGAVIVDSETEVLLYEENLTEDDAIQVFQLGAHYNMAMTAWSKDQLYVNRIDDETRDYQKITGKDMNLIDDYDSLAKQGVTKILWIASRERIIEIQDLIDGKMNETMNHCTSRPTFLEFFSKKVSKATAMERIGKILHIRQEEMIAIGDGQNDIDMINYAGLGIAMGNALEEVKEAADAITLTNAEDGVAAAIEKYILKC